MATSSNDKLPRQIGRATISSSSSGPGCARRHHQSARHFDLAGQFGERADATAVGVGVQPGRVEQHAFA